MRHHLWAGTSISKIGLIDTPQLALVSRSFWVEDIQSRSGLPSLSSFVTTLKQLLVIHYLDVETRQVPSSASTTNINLGRESAGLV
jgi:hypothetical protein